MGKELKVTKMEHLLLIVPHQDDEILLGAGLIYELLKQDKKVTVCIATNGDYGCKDYSKGRGRLRESLLGLKTIGLSSENVIFLGYADTGMLREESFLMKLYNSEESGKIIPSAISDKTYGLEEKPDFHYECFQEHGDYCRDVFLGDLRELLVKTKPDTVLTTHKSDLHGDHEGLFYFVKEVLEEIAEKHRPKLLVGIVHSKEGDETWPVREKLHFTCPKGLEEGGLKWEERLILPLREELKGGLRSGNLKYEALKKYEIALEPEAVDYLMSFIKDEELFWQIG